MESPAVVPPLASPPVAPSLEVLSVSPLAPVSVELPPLESFPSLAALVVPELFVPPDELASPLEPPCFELPPQAGKQAAQARIQPTLTTRMDTSVSQLPRPRPGTGQLSCYARGVRVSAFVRFSLLALALGCRPLPTPEPALPASPATPEPPPSVPEVTRPVPTPLEQVAYVFTDKDRKKKLTEALAPLDELVKDRARALGVPGLVAGVVIDDELVKVSAHGYQDTEAQIPVDADSVFRIGSDTKPLTAAAVLRLRDEGRLSLDAPAYRYLPELERVRPPTSDCAPITVRQLLQHTSGLPRDASFDEERFKAGISERDIAEFLDGLPLVNTPGRQYQYSNFGYTLLGMMVARVSKESYRDYMAKHFFAPLGLTSARWDKGSVDAKHLALSYSRGEDESFVADPDPNPLGVGDSHGGLYLSARDMGRYVAWQLSAYPPRNDPQDGVLARSSLREAQEPGRLISLSAGPAAEASRWAAQAQANAIGFAWHSFSSCDYAHVVYHGGLIEHYGAEMYMLPTLGVGVFAMANFAPVDLGSINRAVLGWLSASGALVPREKRPLSAPELETALARLLEVQASWDEAKYRAMLSVGHQQRITKEREQRELSEYTKLHGQCRAGPMLHYDNPNVATYLLDCERARFEMALYLEPKTGLIDGFVGHSFGVEAIAGSARAAKRALAFLTKKPRPALDGLFAEKHFPPAHLDRLASEVASGGQCELGAPTERDGNGWQHFELSCSRGPSRTLAIRFSDDDPKLIQELTILRAPGGPCAEK